jgi:hypothetical protein
MSNRSSSKQHGLSSANITRPKTKLSKRLNKAKANLRKEERRKVLSKNLEEALNKLK